MPVDTRMLMVAVAEPWLIEKIQANYGERLRKNGELFVTDVIDTDMELEDEAAKITIKVKRKAVRAGK